MDRPKLDNHQHAQVDEWLDRLLEQDLVQAETALAQCEDPLVRDEVLSLLSHSSVRHAEELGVLERGVRGVAPDLLQSDDATNHHNDWTGQVLGNYRLVSEIGRGGMGVVYKGERVSGDLDHQAAIKVLSSGEGGAKERERFLQERQILARLDHPGIARFLDGGYAADGRPFLVLELVDGEPIDAFCSRSSLSARQTVELFLKVCDAVDHAHQQLVVHRDIKPSNLLVVPGAKTSSTQGIAAKIKLLDFGIAKLTVAQDSDAGLTRHGQPLTPNYASPEQILGDPITAATDVFSLGTLLYQLLSGELPQDLSQLTPAQLIAGATAGNVEAPSSRLKSRSQESGRHRLLSQDLDAIVLKAIRPSAEDRYRSVGAFARDLEAFLQGQPVEAMRGGRRYVLRKYLQRNRSPLTVAAGIVALLVAGILVLSFQVQRAERERARAEAIADFSLGILTLADVDQGHGLEFTAREMLDHAATRLSEGQDIQPETKVELLRNLASGYGNLRDWATAGLLLRQVLDHHPDGLSEELRARSLKELAQTHAERGELDEAVRLLEESQKLFRRLKGAQSVEFAQTLSSSTYFQWLCTNSPTSDVWGGVRDGKLAIEIFRQQLGLDSQEEAAVTNYLAGLVQTSIDQGLATEAQVTEMGLCASGLECLRRAVEIRESLGNNIATAQSLNNLALALDSAGEGEEATELLERSIRLHQAELGASHPTSVVILGNLAGMYRELGRTEEARDTYRQAIALRRESAPGEERGFALLWWGLGHAELLLGNASEAIELWSRACDQEELVVTRRAHVALALARLLAKEGRIEEGEERALSAYQMTAETYGPQDSRSAEYAKKVSDFLRKTGNQAEARRLEALVSFSD